MRHAAVGLAVRVTLVHEAGCAAEACSSERIFCRKADGALEARAIMEIRMNTDETHGESPLGYRADVRNVLSPTWPLAINQFVGDGEQSQWQLEDGTSGGGRMAYSALMLAARKAIRTEG